MAQKSIVIIIRSEESNRDAVIICSMCTKLTFQCPHYGAVQVMVQKNEN